MLKIEYIFTYFIYIYILMAYNHPGVQKHKEPYYFTS